MVNARTKKMNSKHYNHRSSKRIKTFQMSYYVYIQCCNNMLIVKAKKGKISIIIVCIYNVVCC